MILAISQNLKRLHNLLWFNIRYLEYIFCKYIYVFLIVVYAGSQAVHSNNISVFSVTFNILTSGPANTWRCDNVVATSGDVPWSCYNVATTSCICKGTYISNANFKCQYRITSDYNCQCHILNDYLFNVIFLFFYCCLSLSHVWEPYDNFTAEVL